MSQIKDKVLSKSNVNVKNKIKNKIKDNPKSKSESIVLSKKNQKKAEVNIDIESVDEDENPDEGIDDEDQESGFEINYHLYESLKETFELELFKIFKTISKKYGEEYMFNQEDLINFYKGYNLEIFYKKTSNHKHKYNNIEIPDGERCCGRVWAGGYMDDNQFGDRCQRKKINKSDYCKQHTENLAHGRFDGEPSQIVKGFYVKQNDKSKEYEIETDEE